MKKVPCLERRFKVSGVDRRAHCAYLAGKAWSSRIILQWLHECAVQAATTRDFDAGDRTLGKWLAQEVQAGRKVWPTPSTAPFLFLQPLASYSGYSMWFRLTLQAL